MTGDYDEREYEVEFMTLIVDKADHLKVIDSDSHFSDFTGMHPSKIRQGKLFLHDLLRPGDRQRVMQAVCKKNARFVYLDFELFGKDQIPVFVYCTGQNLADSSLCRLTVADISKSRKQQEKLRAQAARMNHLIDLVNAGVCLFRVTSEMHIEALYLNETCCRFFGVTKENYKNNIYRLDELIHPEDKSLVFQGIGRTLATGEPMDMEYRIMVHRNEFIWCKCNAGIHNREDRSNPIFHAVFTNITDVKNSEQEADEESDKMVKLFKNMPGAVFYTSVSEPLRVLVASEDFIDFLGYSRSEFFEKHDGNLAAFMNQDDGEKAARYIESEAASTRVAPMDYSIRKKDGTVTAVQDRRRIVEQDDGTKYTVGELTKLTP